MGQYCDSNKLEKNWFNWLLSSSVPDLELYRTYGLLWTKVIGVVLKEDGQPILKNGKTLPDAMSPKRLHCIATGLPFYFESNNGTIPPEGMLNHTTGTVLRLLPQAEELSLLSDSEIHCLETNPFIQYDEVLPKLQGNGFIKEAPAETSWHAMLEDINKMCQGIATKFNLPSEEELNDLANEALLQVMNKLRAKKLVYTPGRAPVFNLLTTTIHRCMYSIMNRRKNQRNGAQKLINDMKAGTLPCSFRSFRLQVNTSHTIRSK